MQTAPSYKRNTGALYGLEDDLSYRTSRVIYATRLSASHEGAGQAVRIGAGRDALTDAAISLGYRRMHPIRQAEGMDSDAWVLNCEHGEQGAIHEPTSSNPAQVGCEPEKDQPK